jgi:hypothetical protein
MISEPSESSGYYVGWQMVCWTSCRVNDGRSGVSGAGAGVELALRDTDTRGCRTFPSDPAPCRVFPNGCHTIKIMWHLDDQSYRRQS